MKQTIAIQPRAFIENLVARKVDYRERSQKGIPTSNQRDQTIRSEENASKISHSKNYSANPAVFPV